jgi:hypothetical protein
MADTIYTSGLWYDTILLGDNNINPPTTENACRYSMVSYIITRMGLKWGNKIYKYFLVGLLIPHIIAVLPLFMLARVIGLYL